MEQLVLWCSEEGPPRTRRPEGAEADGVYTAYLRGPQATPTQEGLLYQECGDVWRLVLTVASGFTCFFCSVLPKVLKYQDLALEPATSEHVLEELGLEANLQMSPLPVPGLPTLLGGADLYPQNMVQEPAMGLSGRTLSNFAI